jgi:hypothetical protein
MKPDLAISSCFNTIDLNFPFTVMIWILVGPRWISKHLYTFGLWFWVYKKKTLKLLYHSERCNIYETVFRELYANDFYTTTSKGGVMTVNGRGPVYCNNSKWCLVMLLLVNRTARVFVKNQHDRCPTNVGWAKFWIWLPGTLQDRFAKLLLFQLIIRFF